MPQKKINWIGSKELMQKVNGINILKIFSVMLTVISLFINPVIAQNNKDTATSNSTSHGETFNNKMLDYSRPGKYHQLLADLVGTWTFKGRHFDWTDSVTSKVALEFSGTVTRKSFANGRFFIVDQTGGKLQMPIQDGKWKEVNYQGIVTEGYDNVKNKFVKTEIGNHLYSDLSFREGTYDSITKSITFNSEKEPVPGIKIKHREVFIFIDKDNYKIEYYQEANPRYILKITEVNYTRVKEK